MMLSISPVEDGVPCQINDSKCCNDVRLVEISKGSQVFSSNSYCMTHVRMLGRMLNPEMP